MAGPAAICIGAGRRRPLEISGLKVFSSLQGPAGELRTIYRETCVAAIATMIDIGNGIWPPRDPWHPSAAGCHRSQADRSSAPRCRRPCTRRARRARPSMAEHGQTRRARPSTAEHGQTRRAWSVADQADQTRARRTAARLLDVDARALAELAEHGRARLNSPSTAKLAEHGPRLAEPLRAVPRRCPSTPC